MHASTIKGHMHVLRVLLLCVNRIEHHKRKFKYIFIATKWEKGQMLVALHILSTKRETSSKNIAKKLTFFEFC